MQEVSLMHLATSRFAHALTSSDTIAGPAGVQSRKRCVLHGRSRETNERA